MTLIMLLAGGAVASAFTPLWWLAPLLAVAAVVCAADRNHRRRTMCGVTQLRRRQLDRYSVDHRITTSKDHHL